MSYVAFKSIAREADYRCSNLLWQVSVVNRLLDYLITTNQ